MRKSKLVLLIVLVFSLLTVFSGCDGEKADLKPTDKFYINDFAEAVTDADEQVIFEKGKALEEKTTAQVVAVTVDTVNGEEISDYSLNLGRKWEIGQKDKDNGVLILLSIKDRNVYISVGYGLEGALPDSKTGRILDNYGVPYFSEDKFSEGLTSVYNAVVNEVLIEYGIEPDEGYIPAEDLPESESDNETARVIISWAALIIIVIIYAIITKGRGFFFIGGPPFGGGFSGGSFRSGGGFSGGGFSGGGGSFGGGGAGRGF